MKVDQKVLDAARLAAETASNAAMKAAVDRRPRQVAILTNQGGCPGGRWTCCPEDAQAAANAGIPSGCLATNTPAAGSQ